MMESGLSAADAILLSDRNSGSNNNGGFGGDGAWWIILFFIFAWGWGGNGFGGFGGGGSAATQGALTREQACIDNNFNNLMRETASISDAVNLGFANLNSTVCNFAYENLGLMNGVTNTINQGFNATNVALMQGQNALSSLISSCCCDERAAIENVRFTIAQEDCNTRNLIQSTATAMMTNADNNTRAILDKLTSQEIAAKDAQIAAQNQRLFAAELAASQAAQNSYLINTLRPTAIPAYLTCSPYASAYGLYGLNGYSGYGSGCGCGCGA